MGKPPQPPPVRPDLDTEGDAAVATEKKSKSKKPRLYKVLLHNDDYTTMEFVVMVLMNVFAHDEANATRIMLHVHQQGVGVAGIYPYDIAETKSHKTMEMARQYEFPLRSSVEPE
jgi:ATP-dependent Clp protease adaptor protein ClpS